MLKLNLKKVCYHKNSIYRPGGIHLFSTHNFWTTCRRTMIKAYSDRNVSTLSEYVFIFVLLCMIQKLCRKKWITLAYISRFYGISFWTYFYVQFKYTLFWNDRISRMSFPDFNFTVFRRIYRLIGRECLKC